MRVLYFLSLTLLPFTAASQHSFGAQTRSSLATQPYDSGLFSPVEDLHNISPSQYTILQHPSFPAHSVRIKESKFCDEEVRAYTGYIDIEARHLFFYFFESRRDPDSDDVIFWTNGGPGSSSSYGLFMELGPCRVTGANTTARFDYSWNEHANIFFIDQPIGVGFSYADYGEQVDSTLEAARDIAAFVAIFFEHFTKFKGRPFHMAGESYAGRYIPVYASEIYDRNAALEEADMTPINLTSIIIGNGPQDFFEMMLSLYELQCGYHGYPPFKSISECVHLKQLVPRCRKRAQQSCKDTLDILDCSAAWEFCWDTFAGWIGERNPYDYRRPCTDVGGDSEACYPSLQNITVYLNQPHVQSILGIDPGHSNYTLNDNALNARFSPVDTFAFRAEHYTEALLERGVRALIYAGDTDYVGNHIMVERGTLKLEWSGQERFANTPLRDWLVDGEIAGRTRTEGVLTFATVHDAGHLVPFDQPKRALELVNRWLAGEAL
ncbi:serine carboxypeptidase [Dichomitus squalens]|uniref:Carboxypeptidase n=1 Tax=Dichomitus squalens TaxID=114155 RepID=A0A4Q9MU82_9APHY|nr:serine carboxypeptidase [Dichomitus squalens]